MGERRCDLYKGGREVCLWEEERCGEERVKRNIRREEMTREEKEKRCGEEGDGLMDFDGWDVLMYEPHPP